MAELEAQAATEPPTVTEKEGPGQSLEQLEALVQTKDQVCELSVCMCVSLDFAFPDLLWGSQDPQNRSWELLHQEIQTLKSQTGGTREAPDTTEREETQQKVQVCVVAVRVG